jgi:hypothetical protein
MTVGRFSIPGEAVRREFAVYIMVAKPKGDGAAKLYVGKTGDNREGCNPVISRAGNHFSFNVLHSQVRNKLVRPEKYDFEFFYTGFGTYGKLSDGKAVVNEMERRLNTLAQEALGTMVINPYKGYTRIPAKGREQLATPARLKKLKCLVSTVGRTLRRRKRT